jgi:PAS domain S-box-containing protein
MAETFELATQEGTRSRERDHSRAHSQNARMNPACEPTIGQIHLQQLFEHSPVPTIVVDRDMRYMTMSQSWREVFGIEAPDILGRSHYDFTPYISEEWKREHQSCLAGETIDNPDDCVRMSDGAEIWMRRRIHPWRDSEGTISGLVITNEIITESVAADQALEYQQRFTRAVLANVEDAILARDAHGRLTLFNNAAKRLHGFDEGADYPDSADNWPTFHHPKDGTPLERDQLPLARAMRGEHIRGVEIVISPEGEPSRSVIVHATPMRDRNGNSLGAVATAHDITSRRMAEARLRDTEAWYRGIFDQSFQSCALLDPDGIVMKLNASARLLAGDQADNQVGQALWDCVWWDTGEESRDLMRGAVKKAMRGNFVRLETTARIKGDRIAPVDFSLKPSYDDTGELRFIIAEARDVTKQRAIQERLRRKESELKLILDHVPVRILLKDDKNNVLRLNDSAARTMGLSVEEAENRHTSDLFPDHAAQFHADDLAVIESGQPKLGMLRPFKNQFGEEGWLRIDKVPYIDPETGERFIFIASADVTAEKQAELERHIQDERYRALYNNTPVMLHSIDPEGRLINVSDFWLEKFGYTREEVIGRKSTEFLTPDSARKAIEEVLPEFMRTGSCKDVEYQWVTKSGQIMDVLLSAIAEWDDNGKIRRSLAVLIDITERRQVEQKLVQAQKMESVGQLTGGLAHDFNNLLGVILGNLQLLERSVGGDQKAERRLGAALGAVDRASELTRRLLAFARRQKLETRSVDPNDLIEGLNDLLRQAVGETIALETHFGADIPMIRTDQTQLESAILNLAVNARDAMPEGGALTIETSLLTFNEDYADSHGEITPGRYVVIAVTDTGTEIPRAKQKKVFDPFYTTKEVGKGSGLGLSMVYGFLNQSGGHVRLYSEVGLGTTFRLYLPTDPDEIEEPKSTSEPQKNALPPGAETILVAEDNTEMREIAVQLLEDLGYQTLVAIDGGTALEILEENPDIDLLFTDIVMAGGTNGVALAEAARRARPDLPVLFTTGYAEAAVLRDGQVSRERNLVTKPYRHRDLALKIRATLDEASDHG